MRGRARISLVVVGAVMTLIAASGVAQAAVKDTIQPTYQTNGRVSSILPVGSTVYISGYFTKVRPPGAAAGTSEVTRNHLAAFNRDTGALLGWNPGANANVYTLSASPDGSIIYMGGDFSTVGGVARTRAAAVSASTGAVLPWTATANAQVRTVFALGSRIYLGGNFTTIKGQSRTRLAALDPAGNLDPSWKPTADALVRTMGATTDGSSIFVAGDFKVINGVGSQGNLARLSSTTGSILPWSGHPGYPIRELAITPTRLYVAGDGSGGHLDAFSVPGGTRLWSLQTDGGVQGIALIGNTVYGGGHFDKVCSGGGSGQPFICHTDRAVREKLVAVDATTGALDPWNPGANTALGVFWLATSGGKLLAGGDFNHIGHNHAQQGYAQFPA